MKSLKRITLLTVLVVAVSVTGCNLDINTDPNSPSSVPNSQLLSSAQIAIVTSFGPNGSGLGQPASIWVHQTMIRSSADNYNPTGTDGNIATPWQNLYAGALADLERIIDQGTESGEFRYVGIAKILKAYTYSMMVDVWGDIPYSEAIGGTANPFPKFDKASDIYASLFSVFDDGIGDLNKPLPTIGAVPSADDLIFGGSSANWIAFAKVAKLRMYNNIRRVQDVSTQAKALVSDPAVVNYGSTAGSEFEMKYFNVAAPENRNPSYVSVSNATTYFSRYFYEILNNKSTLNTSLKGNGPGIVDPRLNYYLYNSLGTSNATAQNPTEYKDGFFLSINFASQGPNQGFDQAKSLSSPGLYFCGGRFDPMTVSTPSPDGNVGGAIVLSTWGAGNVPQRLFPKYQLTFIRAELALAGMTTEDPKALLTQGINEAFAKVNSVAAIAAPTAPPISTAARDAYRNYVLSLFDGGNANKLASTTPAEKMEIILTQKWIANFGNPLESYSDYRRTGYPKMFDPNSDEFSYTNVSRGYPFSFPYRQLDLQLNPNAPAQKLIADPTARVFWDID